MVLPVERENFHYVHSASLAYEDCSVLMSGPFAEWLTAFWSLGNTKMRIEPSASLEADTACSPIELVWLWTDSTLATESQWKIL